MSSSTDKGPYAVNPTGATVNVLGTINVFEAVKAIKDADESATLPMIVYASSAAVLGARSLVSQ